MWSKGAVVIVKRGDEAMANAIEKGLDLKMVPVEEVEDMKRDNFFLKKRCVKAIQQDILDAQLKYGHNWVPPKWANKLVQGFALIVYGISIFVDRYLTIKDR